MKKVVLLPFGEQSHIECLLENLGNLVDQGREREFALLLPTSHLLHEFRHRLVKTASRQLNLTTFDDLVADTLRSSETTVQSLEGQGIGEAFRQILQAKSGQLPKLGRYSGSRDMAQTIAYVLGQLRRAGAASKDLAQGIKDQDDPVAADLLTVWREYDSFLAERGLADIEEQYVLARQLIPGSKALRSLKQVHICWFFDFEPLQLGILDSLAAWGADVTVWMPYDHPAHAAHIQLTLERLAKLGFSPERRLGQVQGHLTENLFITPPMTGEGIRVLGLAAPRLKQELELVAREIKKLAVAGARPQDICLVIPDQRKYLPLMRNLYREHGIELSMPMVADLTAVPWVRELLGLWLSAASGWDRDNLLMVAGNAYITAHLPQDYDGDAVQSAIYSLGGNRRGSQWLTKLDQEIDRLSRQLDQCEETWLLGSIRQPLELYIKARPGIEAWVTSIGSLLAGPLLPREHCELLLNIIDDNIPRITAENSEEGLRDRVAQPQVTKAVKDYLACCELLEQVGPLKSGQFIEEINPWLEQDISLERSSPKAVRVLSPAQVRGLSCDHVFVLGLNQGIFPRPNREHWLLDRIAQLGAAGLGGDSLAQEKVFFHSCIAAAQKGLYLSRQLPGETEAEISTFWRDVSALIPGGIQEVNLASTDILPQLEPEAITSKRQLTERLVYNLASGEFGKAAIWLASQPGYTDLFTAATIEQRRESRELADNTDGALTCRSTALLEHRFGRAVYSISRLEQYAKCPFAFFARYALGLEAAPGDVQEFSPLDRGNLLHWMLENFYLKFAPQADSTKPDTIREPLTVLSRQWLTHRGRDPQDLIWNLRARDAVNLAQPLIQADLAWQQRTGLRPILHEATFGLPGSSAGTVAPGGGAVSFHGKIDRIDIMEHLGETWAVVYDYKTSSEIGIGEILAGRSLQIPVYLAAVPHLLKSQGLENVRVMGGGYYVIKKAKLAGGIWNSRFTKHVKSKLGSMEPEEFQQLEHNLAENSAKFHADIISGKFIPQPHASVCMWCDYKTLCRYDKNRFKLKAGGGLNEA